MTSALTLNPSLVDERIIYEAVYRHVEHTAGNGWGSPDSVLAAQVALKLFPQLGYPVPHWITQLAQHRG